ncbi:NAD-dependent epimerase/dehydratase family protein [Adlercreutzia shanghongiae]|uniref:NAD-dependent epimerase/dehydratase family protein n=1 Tax=Adlercreutzia shanghongiae TaxID=3111773 RepID=A0ABU6J1A8_9ACTN|nr:NAD-dependent epimerase/dehydratase family protein [Adlercreutzia sp. R22]MEC4295539.1 NAD-dependent epimerase/dehydratase family protein [Adlercreutzia sp. R22]
MKKVLLTGVAGFIGAFLAKKLVETSSVQVVGIDNMNDYYDVRLKRSRLEMVAEADKRGVFEFIEGDISDSALINRVFEGGDIDAVVNLAAQAGVRYSIENPDAYIQSNIIGFYNILESCRRYPVDHLVYASSSSVYGSNDKVPYSVDDKTDDPVSLYAATKKSNELMASAYSSLYSIPATGLRFFTVYGPMGRPDMAYFKFAEKIVQDEPIQIYNMGDMWRDFTYVDDIVECLARIIDAPPVSKGGARRHRVYNIGNSSPVLLTSFVDMLERILIDEGVTDNRAVRELLPMQPGDVYRTFADVGNLEADFGFRPATSLEDGLREFARWYRAYRIATSGTCGGLS